MRKWLIRLVIVIAAIAAIPTAGLLLDAVDHQTPADHIKNERLETIKRDWPGNTLDQKGRFMDERNPFVPNGLDLLKWRFGDRPLLEEKHADAWRVDVKDPAEFLSSNTDGMLWLGHASFFIRLGDIGILTDPVFGEPAFLKRWQAVPSPLEKLTDVDYVLISHDHRDHMDEATLCAIAGRFPEAVFLAGLRSEDVLREWVTPTNEIETAGWFQRFDLDTQGLKIYFHPARHWSRRWLLDTNWRLWGSYVIEAGETVIYFGGDSGYADHYLQAAEHFPDIDYFLISIGGYEPRWFMEPNHVTPGEAVAAFRDARAKYLIPMHYGTFDLSDEPPSQPLQLLRREAEAAGLGDRIRPLAINESILIP
jgi:L-ascorbate metabolism protein UlaG (beta-lactamase superfamily)